MLLLVTDDPVTPGLIETYISGPRNWKLHVTADPQDALDVALGEEAQVVVLDLSFATELCRKLSVLRSSVPVIVLSDSPDLNDLVTAFALGADDFVRKPFDARELAARLDGCLRRQAPREDLSTHRVFPGLLIDTLRHEVLRDGTEVHLTPIEFALLELLTQKPGHVISREHMHHDILGDAILTDSINPHIYRLRHKIEVDPRHPEYVLNVRGLGYRFGAP